MSGIVPQLTKPVTGTPLSDFAEGSIIKINESGSPVEFYVAKHDYEPDLNGNGRTLVVRKDCYNERVWHDSRINTYATSAINAWLNADYKSLLDERVVKAIGTTKFYYTIGNGDVTVTTLERAIFLLSFTELGKTVAYAKVEGTRLPIYSTLEIASKDSTAYTQWSRSPSYGANLRACALNSDGSPDSVYVTNNRGSRPVFTLPASIKIRDDGTVAI